MRLMEFDYNKAPITHRDLLILQETETDYMGYDISKLEPEEVNTLKVLLKKHLEELKCWEDEYAADIEDTTIRLFPVFQLDTMPPSEAEKLESILNKQKLEMKPYGKVIRRFKKDLVENIHLHYWK